MDYTNVYSMSKSNANVLLKHAFWALEDGNEQAFFQAYSDYLWWNEFADNWIKGK